MELGDISSHYIHVYGGMNQAYSRLSTTHGHITDCKLDSVVYAGICQCHIGVIQCICLIILHEGIMRNVAITISTAVIKSMSKVHGPLVILNSTQTVAVHTK